MKGENLKKIPHLRICVTKNCPCHCIYCRPGGEGCTLQRGNNLSPNEIKFIIKGFIEQGLSEVKITGGEPLMREDLLEIIEGIKSFQEIKDINLITMNPGIGKMAPRLKEIGLTSVTVSLDSVNPTTFRKITGMSYLSKLIAAIEGCHQAGLPLKFNAVLLRGLNEFEVPALIQFAGKFGATLKLLDLIQVEDNPEFFKRHYLNLRPLTKQLATTAISSDILPCTGGIGTPMPRFLMQNGVTVLVKDATIGTWYGDVCKECSNFPCQDAIMSVRLTSDGFLQRCLIRSDNIVDVVAVRSHDALDGLIATVLKTYQDAEYHPEAWKPKM
jgi:cyclic pyranopterin phosphate synthase